jgi:hypothetical protein
MEFMEFQALVLVLTECQGIGAFRFHPLELATVGAPRIPFATPPHHVMRRNMTSLAQR